MSTGYKAFPVTWKWAERCVCVCVRAPSSSGEVGDLFSSLLSPRRVKMPWQSGACVHHGNSAAKARAGIRWDRCIVIVEKGKGACEGCQKRLKGFWDKESAASICTEMSHFPPSKRFFLVRFFFFFQMSQRIVKRGRWFNFILVYRL